MPEASPEQRARWRDDSVAVRFLTSRGYHLTNEWTWTKPRNDHVVTWQEEDAIIYLMEEWDYGPLS